jgi:hypothetical protein
VHGGEGDARKTRETQTRPSGQQGFVIAFARGPEGKARKGMHGHNTLVYIGATPKGAAPLRKIILIPPWHCIQYEYDLK